MIQPNAQNEEDKKARPLQVGILYNNGIRLWFPAARYIAFLPVPVHTK